MTDTIARGQIEVDLNDERVAGQVHKMVGEVKHGLREIDNSEATLNVRVDKTPIDRFQSEVRAKRLQFSRDEWKTNVKFDLRSFDEQLARIAAKRKELEAKRIEIKANLNIDDKDAIKNADKQLAIYDRGLEKLEARTKRLTANKAKYEINVQGAQRAVAEIESVEAATQREHNNRHRLTELRKKEDLDAVRGMRDSINMEAEYIKRSAALKKVSLKLGIDGEKARAELAVLRTEMSQRGITIPVDIDRHGFKNSAVSFLQKALGTVGLGGSGAGGGGGTKLFGRGSIFAKGPDINPGAGYLTLGTALTALPLAAPIAGGALGLGGALGAGAAGAGAVGGGLFAGLATNILGTVRAFDVFKQETSEADKALIHLEETTRKFGVGSKQSLTALAEYNEVLKEMSPAAREFSLVLKNAQDRWNQFTKPIQGDIQKVVGQYGKTINALIPGLAKNTNDFGKIITDRLTVFATRLRGPELKGFIGLGASANNFIKPALDGLEKFSIGLLHIGESAAKTFGGPLGKWFQKLGGDFERATQPGDKLDHTVKTLGEDAKKVGDFFIALGKIIFDALRLAAPSGVALTETMTHALERWDEKLTSSEGRKKFTEFLHRSNEFLERLGPLLESVFKLFGAWAIGLIPAINAVLDIANGLTKLVNAFGKLLGLKSGIESLGVAIGIAFAAGRMLAFARAAGKAYETLKLMSLLTLGGEAGTAGKVLLGTAGAGAAGKVAPKVASKLGVDVVEGAAGAGGVGVVSAIGAGTVALAAGATAAAVGLGILGQKLTSVILGAPMKESGESVEDETKKMHAYAKSAKDAAQAVYELQAPSLATGQAVEQDKIAVIRAYEALVKTKAGTLEHREALASYREAVNRLREAEEARHKVIHKTEATSDEAVAKDRERLRLAVQRASEARSAIANPKASEQERSNSIKMLAQYEKERVDAAKDLNYQLNQQASNLLNIQRTARGLAPVTEPKGVKALGELSRAPETHGLAVKIAVEYEAPQDVSKVAEEAQKAIKAGVKPSVVLSAIAHTHDAKEAFAVLRDDIAKHAHEASHKFEKEIHDGAGRAAAAFRGGFDIATPVKNAMDDAKHVLGVKLKDIGAVLGADLIKLGSFAGDAGSKANKGLSTIFAQGGLVQVGQPGMGGPDNREIHAMVGDGEQVAVFTRHQQEEANTQLADIGGLAGLFSNKTPHYMAKGGFVPSEAYAGLTRGRIDQGVDFGGSGPVRAISDGHVRSTGLWPGWPGTGGVVYESNKGGVYIMEDFRPTVKQGQKLKAGQIVGYATGGPSGIETGWTNAAGTAPIVRYGNAPDGTPMSGGKSFARLLGGGFGAGIASALKEILLPDIKEPHVGGTGAVHKLVQTAVKLATKVANKSLHAEMARVNGRAGTAPGELTGSVVTASEFGGHNDPSAYGHKTASGRVANDSLMGFAELSSPPSSFNFSALGGLPMGTNIKVSYHGKTITIPKVDVGQGGPGLGHVRAIDLTYAAARALHAPGLENVHWQKAAEGGWMKGGKWNKPALLVGEHENEYVINPSRRDNAAYLKQAGQEMGYNVTAAKKGKGKAVVKNLLKNRGELPSVSFAEARSIPAEIIDPIIANIKSTFTTEKANYHSVQVSKDKTIEQLAKSKDAASKALADAHKSGDRAVGKAQAGAKAAEKKAAEAEAIAGKYHDNTPAGADKRSKAKHQGDAARQKAGRAVHDAESARSEKIRKATQTHNKHIKEVEKKLKHLDEGLHKIKEGGVWEHTRYTKWSTLEKDERQAKAVQNALKGAETHVSSLNKEIANETHALSLLQGRYKLAKNKRETGSMAKFASEWASIFESREGHLGSLRGFLEKEEKEAQKFAKAHPQFPQMKGYIEAILPEIQAVGDVEIQAGGEAEAGVSGAGAEGEVLAPVGPPSAEEFLEKTTPTGRGNVLPYLQALERKIAEVSAHIIPDNPNTPVNEELPSLIEEREAAKPLAAFWERELGEAIASHEPDVTIRDVAQQTASARSSYQGFVRQVEEAEKSFTSQTLAEANEFSRQRMELYKNFGSNFQPVWTKPAATTPPAGAQPQHANIAAVHTPPAPSIKNITINHENNFSTPPPNPHHWSNSVAFEMQAAI